MPRRGRVAGKHAGAIAQLGHDRRSASASIATWQGRATSVHSARQAAVGRKELQAAILAIGDVDRAGAIDGDAVRHVKLPGPAPGSPQDREQSAVGREAMDAGVAVAVGDVHLAAGASARFVGKLNGPAGLPNRAIVDRAGAGVGRLAARAQRQQQLAVGRELVHRVVEVVDAIDRVVRPDRECRAGGRRGLRPRSAGIGPGDRTR